MEAVAKLHCEAFPNDIRSQLGPKVVARSLEHMLSGQTDRLSLGAFKQTDGTLVAFCLGGLGGRALASLGVADTPLIISQIVLRPLVLTRPSLYKRMLASSQRLLQRASPKTLASQASNALAMRYYEIFSLAVRVETRGTGLGKLLMQHHEAYALQLKCTAISLSSPVDDTNTLAFYERIGFRKRLAPDGLWQGRMFKLLNFEPEDKAAMPRSARRRNLKQVETYPVDDVTDNPRD